MAASTAQATTSAHRKEFCRAGISRAAGQMLWSKSAMKGSEKVENRGTFMQASSMTPPLKKNPMTRAQIPKKWPPARVAVGFAAPEAFAALRPSAVFLP